MSAEQAVKYTALHEAHDALNARMGEFAGYMMPIWYEGIKAEHLAVRKSAGIFDLSHMGEFFITGPQAFDLVQYLTCNDVRRIGDGQCQYTLFPTPGGGVVDDLIAYQYTPEKYMLVVNASNIDKDLAWVNENNRFNCKVANKSDSYSLVAVQGPDTDKILTAVGIKGIKAQKAFTFRTVKVDNRSIIVAGTGYTGERGFELIVDNGDAMWLWQRIMDVAGKYDAVPVGLGARDTLRLEMAYSLYGQELSDSISVLEAGLAWTVRFGPEFIGKEFLQEQSETGVERIVCGLVCKGKSGAPRTGDRIFTTEGQQAGTVTSGSFSPSLEQNIALALLNVDHKAVGTQLSVEVRNRQVPVEVCEPPFYKR